MNKTDAGVSLLSREQSLKLADDLERLCCAETEGKFFDLVTDSIDTILAALRAHPPEQAKAELSKYQADNALRGNMMPDKDEQLRRIAAERDAARLRAPGDDVRVDRPTPDSPRECPFCRSVSFAEGYESGDQFLFKVHCSKCPAQMRGFDQCQQDAIDAWNTRAAPTDAPGLDEWIEREFSGHGRAVRTLRDPPIDGEPFMSMADAKELTRAAVAAFAAPARCDAMALSESDSMKRFLC